IAIVWFLTGLWHGAYWNFVLWGVYYGVLLVLEKFFLLRILQKLPAWCGHIYTILCTLIGMSLFSYQDMADGPGYLQTLYFQGKAGWYDQQTLWLTVSNIGLFFIAAVGCTSLMKRLALEKCLPASTKKGAAIRDAAAICYTAAVFAACLGMLVNSSYNPFLYFRF
ncbi:MAG: MBOAT family protein, partial [Eubacterium sp.]|nr:MBOAT family protein [Eubacterium sp.]